MHDLVSIITPNYNGAAFIAETIRSVQAQTHTEWEMIIVDDCSSDDSVSIIQGFLAQDGRIQLLQLPTRSGGPARPRNIALNHAQGKYVAFLDNDDLWHPQKLALQVQAMKKYGVAVSSAAMIRFSEASDVQVLITPLSEADIRVRRITHAMLLRRHFTPHIVAERRLFELQTANGKPLRFNEDPRYVAIEDYECWLRLHQTLIPYSIKLSPPLWYYRQPPHSISRSKWPMAKKNYIMYTEYTVSGRPLGWKAYWYLAIYAMRSAVNRLAMQLKIPAWNTVDY
jgi:glycosyltransferase involved in cell wall biosynthesis